MAASKENQDAIGVHPGALDALKDMLAAGPHSPVAVTAAAAIGNLAINHAANKEIARVAGASHGHKAVVRAAARALGRALGRAAVRVVVVRAPAQSAVSASALSLLSQP